MSGLELAALLAQGALPAAEVHDLVVASAWFGLRCGAAMSEGAGQSTQCNAEQEWETT